MKEKKIESKLINIKLVSIIIFIFGLILGVVLFFTLVDYDQEIFTSRYCKYLTDEYETFRDCHNAFKEPVSQYIKHRNQNSYWIALYSCIFGFGAVSVIYYLMYRKQKIYINDKNIYGTSTFGKKLVFR